MLFNRRTSILCAAAFAVVPVSRAQDRWPDKPIRLIVPFEGGAGTDLVHRYYARHLSIAFGQEVVVENIGGAAGAIGAARVARSAPDGYTLLGTQSSQVVGLPHLQKLSYDPLKDFTPVAQLASPISIFIANTLSAIATMQQAIDQARREPGAVTYGTAGYGSAQHYRFAALEAAAGIKLRHVPYKGASAYVPDLLSNRIQLAVDGGLAIAQAKLGTVKLLAIVDDKRLAEFPDVPAIKEVVPAYAIPRTWLIIEGPAGLPSAISRRLAVECAKITALPETAQFLKVQSMRASIQPPDFDLAGELQRDYEVFGDLTRKLGVAGQ